MGRLKQQIAGDPGRFVDALADRMVEKLGRTEPPFQTGAFEYAALSGATVIEADIQSSGLMSCFNGRLVIEICRGDRPEKKNYTVGHEVGHIEIRRAAKLLPGSSSRKRGRRETMIRSSGTEEWMANRFAANVLAPRNVFCADAKEFAPGLENAMVLAKRYRISLGATLRRIITVGAWECVMLWGIPEKMGGNDRWAVKVHEFRTSLGARLICPDHKSVWWAANEVREAFGCPDVVEATVPIGDEQWRFEGFREWHYTNSGERENRVMAMLLPNKPVEHSA